MVIRDWELCSGRRRSSRTATSLPSPTAVASMKVRQPKIPFEPGQARQSSAHLIATVIDGILRTLRMWIEVRQQVLAVGLTPMRSARILPRTVMTSPGSDPAAMVTTGPEMLCRKIRRFIQSSRRHLNTPPQGRLRRMRYRIGEFARLRPACLSKRCGIRHHRFPVASRSRFRHAIPTVCIAPASGRRRDPGVEGSGCLAERHPASDWQTGIEA